MNVNPSSSPMPGARTMKMSVFVQPLAMIADCPTRATAAPLEGADEAARVEEAAAGLAQSGMKGDVLLGLSGRGTRVYIENEFLRNAQLIATLNNEGVRR